MKIPVINKFLLILKVHYFLFQAGIAPTQTALPVYAQTLGFSSVVVGTVYTVIPLTGMIIKPGLGALADKFKWHKQVMLASELLLVACYFSVQFIPSGQETQQQQLQQSLNSENFCANDTAFYACQNDVKQPTLLYEYYIKAELPNSCTMNCPIAPETLENFCKRTEVCFSNTSALLPNFKETAPAAYVPKDHCQRITPRRDLLKTLSFCQKASNCSKIVCPAKIHTTREQDVSTTFQQYQIYVFILLLIGSWGGVTMATTLSDTICIAKSGDWNLYGSQRMWGSIGYGALSIIIGSIVDAISEPGQNKNYTPAFYSTLVVLLIDIVISQFYLHVEIPEKSQNITKDVWKVFLNPRVMIFLVWCTAMGASMGVAWTFLYWMLESLAKDYGADTVASIKTIEGLVNGVQTFVGEVPAFFFAWWVLRKIGHGHCMTLIFLIVGVRYVCYSLLVNPWYILFIEPMQIYYGLFYSTLTSFATIMAPPGTQATVQSLMCAFVEGIGVAIGSFLGGIFVQDYGPSMTFRIFGITFLILAVVNEIVNYFYQMVPAEKVNQREIEE